MGSLLVAQYFTAKLCERISAKFGPTNGSEYLVGLIHDIGWLFLATYFPGEFTQIFTCGSPVWQAEKQFLPFNHAEVSAVIALRAELPLRAFNAILYHHETGLLDLGGSAPQRSPRFLGIVLSVCDRIADCHQMDMFAPLTRTMEQIQKSPEVQWLGESGDVEDLAPPGRGRTGPLPANLRRLLLQPEIQLSDPGAV